MAIEHTETGTIFTREHVWIYQMVVVAKGLRLYAKTGMRVNTAYTPKRMMQVAARLTGKTFKPRDYLGAAEALEAAAAREELAAQS